MNLQPFEKSINITSTCMKTKIVGAFSIDKNEKLHNDFRGLKYFKIPTNIHFNLNDGDFINKAKKQPLERLNQMTAYIMSNKDNVVIKDYDLVCFRGVLKRILMTPYNTDESWVISAIKFKGTIYMCLIDTSHRKEMTEIEKARDAKFTPYGFKFESYVMSSHPNMAPPGKSETVFATEEFCVTMSLEIDVKSKILMGIEVDGIRSSTVINSIEELRKVELIEVKTQKEFLRESGIFHFYKYKSLSWWAQSYLAGVENIYTGMRDAQGIVKKIRLFGTDQLAEGAEMRGLWMKSVCINFLSKFIDQLKTDTINVDDPNIVFLYSWNPKVSSNITLQKRNIPGVITQHYIDFINNL